MKLIKLKIKEILHKEKFSYKYFNGISLSSPERTGYEWELIVLGDNDKKYLIRLGKDGRKALQFYINKEVYGMEEPVKIMRTQRNDRDEIKSISWWNWTKEKFGSSLDQHIQRAKEFIESEKLELERLLNLKKDL